jgi:hypothetical protein
VDLANAEIAARLHLSPEYCEIISFLFVIEIVGQRGMSSVSPVSGAVPTRFELAENVSACQKVPDGKLFQFTKICRFPKLTIAFSGDKINVSFSMTVRQYP